MVLFRLHVVNPVSNLVDIFYMCFNELLRPVYVLDADVSMGITAVLLVFTCSEITTNCFLVPYCNTTCNLKGDAVNFFNHPTGQ